MLGYFLKFFYFRNQQIRKNFNLTFMKSECLLLIATEENWRNWMQTWRVTQVKGNLKSSGFFSYFYFIFLCFSSAGLQFSSWFCPRRQQGDGSPVSNILYYWSIAITMKIFVDAEDSKPNLQLAWLPELPCCEGSQLMGVQPELLSPGPSSSPCVRMLAARRSVRRRQGKLSPEDAQ